MFVSFVPIRGLFPFFSFSLPIHSVTRILSTHVWKWKSCERNTWFVRRIQLNRWTDRWYERQGGERAKIQREEKKEENEVKKEELIEKKIENVNEEKKDNLIEEKKEIVNEVKKEEPIEEKKDNLIEAKKVVNEEKKDYPNEEKKEEPTEEKKENANEEKKEEPTEQKKENANEVKKEEPTEEKKEGSSKGSFWSGYAFIASIFGGIAYLYAWHVAYDETIDKILSGVSPSRSEVEDLQKTDIDKDDFLVLLTSFKKKFAKDGKCQIGAEYFARQVCLASKQLNPNSKLTEFDLLCLYRNAQQSADRERRIDLLDLMVGVALLIDPVKTSEDKAEAAAHVALVTSDKALDPNPLLDAKDLAGLFERMYRVGHFSSRSLVEQISYLPPIYNMKSFEKLASETLLVAVCFFQFFSFIKEKDAITPKEFAQALRKLTKSEKLIAF